MIRSEAESYPAIPRTERRGRSHGLGDLVDHFFLGDQVRGLLNQAQELVNVVGPFGQDSWRITGRHKANYPRGAIDSSKDGLVDHQVGQELLGRLSRLARLTSNSPRWRGPKAPSGG